MSQDKKWFELVETGQARNPELFDSGKILDIKELLSLQVRNTFVRLNVRNAKCF